MSSPISQDSERPKVQNFGGRSPPKFLLLWLVVLGCSSPVGGGSPIVETSCPIPPSAGVADGTRNWARGFGKTPFPSPIPLSPILFHDSMAFFSTGYFEIRVQQPEFSNAACPTPCPFALIVFLDRPTILDSGVDSPLSISPIPSAPPGAPSLAPPI